MNRIYNDKSGVPIIHSYIGNTNKLVLHFQLMGVKRQNWIFKNAAETLGIWRETKFYTTKG